MDFDEEDDREECLIMNRLAAVRRVKKLISNIYIFKCVSEVIKDVAQNLIHLQSYRSPTMSGWDPKSTVTYFACVF